MIADVGDGSQPVWSPLGREVLLWNLHLTAPVYFAEARPVTKESDSIPPLGSVVLDGTQTVYASSLDASLVIPLQVTPGGRSVQPSPAQVADQLDALGLAKDTSVQAVHTTLGNPAQDASITALPAQLQPAMQSTSLLRQAAGLYTVANFGGASRIWALHLSFAAATLAAYAAGITQLYAELKTGSGLALTVIELAVAAASQAENGDSDLVFTAGLNVPAADTLILDVNNNVALTNGTLRASCTALYSSP
jgi:hypothetical protein